MNPEKDGIELILDLIDTDLWNFIKCCLKKTTPDKAIRKIYFLSFALVIISSLVLSYGNATIDSMRNILDLSNNIYLALFAASLTGFAFITAILKPKTIEILSTIDTSFEKSDTKSTKNTEVYSKFTNYTKHIIGVIFYFMIIIILNFFMQIVFSILPVFDKTLLSTPEALKTIISFISITCYLSVILHGIFEMFSLVFNLFALYSYDNYISIKTSQQKKGE